MNFQCVLCIVYFMVEQVHCVTSSQPNRRRANLADILIIELIHKDQLLSISFFV